MEAATEGEGDKMILCSEVIWTGKLTSTYCMRLRGHSGDHSIEPDKPSLEVQPSKEEILLSNYGPYKKDDPKSNRGF